MIYEEPGDTPGTKRTITQGGLPALTGSETDVTRAMDVRTRILVDADDALSRLRSDQIITEAQSDTDIVSPRQVSREQVHAAEVALNKLRGQTSAEWWIAQSERSASDLLTETMLSAAD